MHSVLNQGLWRYKSLFRSVKFLQRFPVWVFLLSLMSRMVLGFVLMPNKAALRISPAGACATLIDLLSVGPSIDINNRSLEPKVRAANFERLLQDNEIAHKANHRGIQQFQGRNFGINALTPIAGPVVWASPSEDLTNLSDHQKWVLENENPQGTTFQVEANAHDSSHRRIFENMGNGKMKLALKPDLDYVWETFYDFFKREGEESPAFVGKAIRGFEYFQGKYTQYAGKIRKFFAILDSNQRHEYWVEIGAVRGGEELIFSVSLTGRWAEKDYPCVVYRGPVVNRNPLRINTNFFSK